MCGRDSGAASIRGLRSIDVEGVAPSATRRHAPESFCEGRVRIQPFPEFSAQLEFAGVGSRNGPSGAGQVDGFLEVGLEDRSPCGDVLHVAEPEEAGVPGVFARAMKLGVGVREQGSPEESHDHAFLQDADVRDIVSAIDPRGRTPFDGPFHPGLPKGPDSRAPPPGIRIARKARRQSMDDAPRCGSCGHPAGRCQTGTAATIPPRHRGLSPRGRPSG